MAKGINKTFIVKDKLIADDVGRHPCLQSISVLDTAIKRKIVVNL